MPLPPQPTPAAVGLTYVEFHLLFLVPPLAFLTAGAAAKHGGSWRVRPWGVALIAAVAVLYTAPWDNYLIARGVWSYGGGSVAATLWHMPVEEYLFVLVQPVIAALWLGRIWRDPGFTMPLGLAARTRLAGVLAAGAIGAAGAALLLRSPTFYLGAILAWAAPVLALQWGFGWPYLWRRRRTVALGVLVPTAYLCLADWVAIRAGVWSIAARYTTGVELAGLPVEEALFFLVTNAFVVQGLVLLEWVIERWR